ncbi:Ubiquinone biosynthesis protein COQ4, mitochondrial, partial [Araneus ventricosus]
MFVNKPHVFRFCFRFLPRIYCNKRLSTQSTSSSEKIEDELHLEHTSENFTRSIYDGHIQTSVLQKALLTIGSSVLAITDPYRHDMVAVLGETTGYVAAKQIKEKMSQDPEGSSIL